MRRRRLPVVLAALLALAATRADAATFAPKQFEHLVREAEQIVVATVTAVPARRLPAGAIVTDVELAASRVLKGAVSASRLSLLVLGGTLGGETERLDGVPVLHPGVTYLLFVRGNGGVVFPVVGGTAGVFQVTRDPRTGEDLVLDAEGRPLTDVDVPLAVFLEAIADELRR